MSAYISQTYADLLAPSDILALVGYYEASQTRSGAARAFGVQRKTLYDWEKMLAESERTGYLKPASKRKVVKTLLEEKPDETLSLILERLLGAATEVLQVYLTLTYESGIKQSDPQGFLDIATKFNQIRKQYANLIVSKLDREIADLLSQLAAHGKELHSEWTASPPTILDSKQLERIIPNLIKRAKEVRTPKELEQIAIQTRLPLQLVNSVYKEINRDLELSRLSPDFVRVSLAFLPSQTNKWLEGYQSFATAQHSGTVSLKPDLY